MRLFNFRIEDEALDAIEEAATKTGKTKSEFARDAVTEAAYKISPPKPTAPVRRNLLNRPRQTCLHREITRTTIGNYCRNCGKQQ